jgi:hypothetical protein
VRGFACVAEPRVVAEFSPHSGRGIEQRLLVGKGGTGGVVAGLILQDCGGLCQGEDDARVAVRESGDRQLCAAKGAERVR